MRPPPPAQIRWTPEQGREGGAKGNLLRLLPELRRSAVSETNSSDSSRATQLLCSCLLVWSAEAKAGELVLPQRWSKEELALLVELEDERDKDKDKPVCETGDGVQDRVEGEPFGRRASGWSPSPMRPRG